MKLDSRERFQLLMKQAEIPQEVIDEHFSSGMIEKVECSLNNREWNIHLYNETLVPQDIYRAFSKKIQDTFSHIAKISFSMRYSDDVKDSDLVQSYWKLFLDWIQREVVSVNGWMTNATVECRDKVIHLTLLDQTAVEIAKNKQIDRKLIEFFQRYFGRFYRVQFHVNEHRADVYEKFAMQIEEETRSQSQSIISNLQREESDVSKADAQVKLMLGYEIQDQPVPIKQITEEENKITIQGTVLNLERRELRNGSTLFQFILTDFTDSLSVKYFAKNKEDLKMLGMLANGKWVKARGRVEYDRFPPHELSMIPSDLCEVQPPQDRMDDAEAKRVEFHLHTNMSTMDAVTPVKDYIQTAAKWGHKAIAITDHGGVQAFPEAFHAARDAGIKVIYGVEANIVNDSIPIVYNANEQDPSTATYVVYDVETTGLSVTNNKIIEIAGVKMKDGQIIDKYHSFVDPHEKIPYHISQLTNITDDMVKGAPELDEVMRQFHEFAGDAVLVAHNAAFDMGFIQYASVQTGLPKFDNPVLDTLELARYLYPQMKNHRLNTLADKFKVPLESHHRAIDDAEALGHILTAMLKDVQEKQIDSLAKLNQDVGKDLSNVRPFHACIYAKNAMGKKNLYKLISLSHTEYFNRVPCIPKSKLIELREGLIIASGCEKGELFETVLNKTMEEAEEVARFYDVLEIQPVEINMHLVEKGLVGSRKQLEEANRKICELGEKLNIPVIATGNVHYLHPRDKIFRDITIHGITGFSPLKEMKKPDVHFRTTQEMLELFSYLGEEKAEEVVIHNTNKLADLFEEIELFPSKPFFPVIEGADQEIRETCYAEAKRRYGDPLPDIVAKRLEKELGPIIKYGFAALFLISERLVKKSLEDGYLVGSRGSVGSSVVAMLLGISEVNPLPPHYVCTVCKHSEWFADGSVRSGFDLPDKACPSCGETMKGDGQDITFETFLGFKGDKVPDIDLNFSGEYQPHAHNYTKVLFGEKNVFRAGTISTVAEKTAYGYVKKYEEDHGLNLRNAEVLRLSQGCTGVKRSTGQHPGGIVVVPDYIEVEDITPVQYPADDTSAEWKTTHFDYHAYDENLLKLDILGHDDPTMMRMLHDITGVDPTTIPMNDPKVMSVFNSTEALGVTEEQIRTPVGTYGIPEMGTKFVRQMLHETKPSSFADLLQISGLSHGTGVWVGNAQELIRNGTCTIKTVIGCRDDIMIYLIYNGLEASLAFQITESVRKGRGLKEEWIEIMKEHNIPQWYIESCQKIEYMFPKAHAAAYVIFAVRTVYYKLYHPIAFYAAYFSVRAEEFDVDIFCQGYDAIYKKLDEIEAKGFDASPKEKSMVPILEMGLEMTARGFSFKGIDLYRSAADKFKIDGDSLIPPFSAIPGIGLNAARNIVAAREEAEFISIEDFQRRSKASKTVVDTLASMGCFRGLPESNQLALF